jgi:hypothetical protein
MIMDVFGVALLLTIGGTLIMLYFLPGYIATHFKHRNAGAIWALNVVAGWTFLGWLVALVWACMASQREGYAPHYAPPAAQVSSARWQSSQPIQGICSTGMTVTVIAIMIVVVFLALR